MRLKLNRTLRTALIAAITAAGFTLSQAQAEQQLTITPTSWTGSHTNISWTEQTGTLNSWKLTFDLTVKNGNANDFFNISSNNNTAQAGWALGTTGTTLQLAVGGKTGSPAVITLSDAFALNTAQTITYQFVRDVDDEGASLGTGTFTVTAGELTSSYKVDSLTDTALVSGNGGRGHIWANGNPGQHQLANITLTQLDDHVVTIPTSTWKGTRESHNWADSVWDTGTYQDGSKAVFGAEGYNEVTVSAATTAASVSVSDQEYTFEITVGGSLTAAKANIAESGSLTITGAGSATITSLSGAGDLTVGENGTATVNGLNSYTGTMNVTDGGTLNLGSSITLDSLTVENGTVTTQHNAASGVVANTLTIGEGGTFKVIGGHDAFGYNAGATKEIDMRGSSEHHAKLALEQNTTNSATMTTNIVMHGYSDITVKDGGKGFNTYGGNITVDGVENTIAVIDLRNAVTIDVAEAGELSVGKFTVNGTSTAAVTKTGDGIMTITEASTLPGALNINGGAVSIGADTTIAGLAIAATGSLTVAGGTTTVSGNTNVLSNTISVTGGTLTLNGTYEIGGNTGEMKTTYEGGEVAGNGFEHVAGSATVYTKAEGATVNDNATYTVGGQTVTVENGVYTTEGTTNYGTFYVKSEEESLAKAISYAGEHTVSIVSLAEGTTINADSAGASIGLALESGAGATVNATEATTISSVTGWDGNKLIIEGEAAVSLRPGSNIVMAAGTGLQVDTEVAAQKIQLNGAGANLTVADGGTLTTSNNLTVTTGTADIHGTVNVGHEVDLSDGSKSTGTLHIHGGGDVTVKDGMWMATTAVGVLLDEDATYTITGKNVSFSGKEGGNGSIKASGAEVNYTTENTHAAITNLTMTALGDITIANTLDNVDVVTGEHAVTLNAAANSVTVGTDGYLTFGTSGSASSITIEDGGVLGSYTKTGEGEATITSKGTAIMTDTIGLQAGKLTMTGEYNIDYLDGDVEITGYEGGLVDGNGFAHETGTIQVVNIAEGATLDATEGTFVRGGNDLKLTDGGVTVDSTNYAGFYINTESETVTTAKNMEYEHGPLSFIYVEEGATLVVDQNINGSLVDTWSSGTVNIQEGKTVTGTMEGVALAGSGTYDLGSTAALGTGTTLGEDWTGVVRLSNLVKEDGNSAWLSGLANGESWVELINFKGYDRAWASSYVPAVTANIILTDDADHNAAWNLSAYARTETPYTMVLTGDVKGDGTFLTAGGTDTQSQAIEFRGDISGWEGAFVADAPGMRQVVFTGDASDVNASITKVGEGALNLVVGNGSDVFDAVFSAEVSVSSVNVKANASATFSESTTATTVTNAGTVMFNTLEGLTQAITNTGDVIFNSDFEVTGFQETSGESGYFDLGGTFSTDGNGYAGTSDSYLTIVDGGTVAADNIVVTQDGEEYTMNNSGLALKGDRTVDYVTFYVNDGTVSYAAIANDGHGARFIEVTGGTLDVDTTPGAPAITVTGEGTLTGDELDVTGVHIEQDAIVHVTDELVSEGVTFYAAEGGDVSITNTGRKRAYSTENGEMLVQAGGIVKTTEEAEGNVTVSNILEVGEIINTQGGKLTLDGVSEAIEVKNLIIGLAETPAAVEMLASGSTDEATVTITEALAAANGTLLANLVMADDSALLVGGVEKALHVGSTLTMGQNIALDGTTLQALDDLAIGEFFWLISAAEGRELTYEGPIGEDAWYDSVFSRTAYDGEHSLQGDFNIVFDDVNGFGLQKFSDTPEPTTGTLSLLALCALAARRRRRH